MLNDPTVRAHLAPVLLLLFTACGGGEQPPADQPPPEPAEAVPTYPPQECPEGATYREATTSKGVEQICEKDGIKHGPFKVWYSPELRAVDGVYSEGLPDDNWVWWYPNGNKKTKGGYNKSKQTGPWTWWYENGNTSEEGDFLQGRKAGTWTRYFESGKKLEEGLFHNGVKNGTWEYYRDDAENTLKRRERWQAGASAETTYFDATGKKEIKEPLPEDVDTDDTEAGGDEGSGGE